MDPMFLPQVEAQDTPSPYLDAIRAMQARGAEYPQIWHLARFTQAILRGPAPLSPGLRELIAAYTSARNHCPF